MQGKISSYKLRQIYSYTETYCDVLLGVCTILYVFLNNLLEKFIYIILQGCAMALKSVFLTSLEDNLCLFLWLELRPVAKVGYIRWCHTVTLFNTLSGRSRGKLTVEGQTGGQSEAHIDILPCNSFQHSARHKPRLHGQSVTQVSDGRQWLQSLTDVYTGA